MNYKNDRYLILSIITGTIVGGFLRLNPVLGSDFPIQDGGLFYAIVQDILRGGITFPENLSYNNADLPFVYPPLSFFLTSIISLGLDLKVLEIVRILPSIISILTIPVLSYLSYLILGQKIQTVFATFAFATIPIAFDWLIVGGGLTRALGFLFSLMALTQVYQLFHKPERRYILSTVIYSTMTIYTHPAMTWFTIVSAAVFLFFWGRSQEKLYRVFYVIAGIILLVLPWAVYLQNQYGLGYVFNAFNSKNFQAGSMILALLPVYTKEPYLDILGILSVIGVFAAVKYRRFSIIIWLIVLLFAQRVLTAGVSTVPLVMLVAIGLDRVVLPGLSSILGSKQTTDGESIKINSLQGSFLAYLFILTTFSGYIASPRDSLTSKDLEAMAFINKRITPSKNFLILVVQDGSVIHDFTEWFPALTRQTSLNTFQGYEWLPGKEWDKRRTLNQDLQNCVNRSVKCIQDMIESIDQQVDYFILVTPGNTGKPSILYSLQHTRSDFELIFSNEQVWVHTIIVP